MIRGFLITVTLLSGLVVVVMNTGQTVVLSFLLGFSTRELPVYQLVIGGFLTGIILSALLIIPEWVKLKWKLKKQKKAFRKIEKQLNRVRPAENEPLADTHTTSLPDHREAGDIP